MGRHRKGKAVTERTPEEILAAIDKALEETTARLSNAAQKPRRDKIRPPQQGTYRKPETPEEILEAIDKALEDTRRQLAEADAGIDAPD
jgi:Ni,Fe-hydrogenase III small subunit